MASAPGVAFWPASPSAGGVWPRRPSNRRSRSATRCRRSPGYRSPSSGSASPTSRRSSWFFWALFSGADEYHPWRENGRSQPRTGRCAIWERPERQLLTDIVVPAALPSIFAGLRYCDWSWPGWLRSRPRWSRSKAVLVTCCGIPITFFATIIVLAAMISIGLLGYPVGPRCSRRSWRDVLHWQSATTVQGREGPADGGDRASQSRKIFSRSQARSRASDAWTISTLTSMRTISFACWDRRVAGSRPCSTSLPDSRFDIRAGAGRRSDR